MCLSNYVFRPSVTLVHCVETAMCLLKLFSLFCITVIPVYVNQARWWTTDKQLRGCSCVTSFLNNIQHRAVEIRTSTTSSRSCATKQAVYEYGALHFWGALWFTTAEEEVCARNKMCNIVTSDSLVYICVYDHISKTIRDELHWLPVAQRIVYTKTVSARERWICGSGQYRSGQCGTMWQGVDNAGMREWTSK